MRGKIVKLLRKAVYDTANWRDREYRQAPHGTVYADSLRRAYQAAKRRWTRHDRPTGRGTRQTAPREYTL